MTLSGRAAYWRRVIAAYVLRHPSQLTFWHEVPEVNARAPVDQLGEYYMRFAAKADYPGPYDPEGIPLLDYHGRIGRQYNPIAIAQYGLGNCNLFRQTRDALRRQRFLRVADWLVANLERNPRGEWVWNHYFDWEYRTPLRAPWYSALAQGQGISVLVRAFAETGTAAYREAADRALHTFLVRVDDGGVTYVDPQGYAWFEETIVTPPTHILNGFMWAAWGVYDYALLTRAEAATRLFVEAVRTLRAHLPRFDTGFWSLYEQSGMRMKMLASPFYHHLHVVQLRVMHRLTGEPVFAEFADRWERYRRDPVRRTWALLYKSAFKLLYY